MKDSMAWPGEAPQVMLQLPLPSGAPKTCSSLGLRFHWLVQPQAWKGHFFPKRGNSEPASTLSK